MLCCAFLSVLLAFASAARLRAAEVSVWIYHNYPPFIIDMTGERGLSYDLARMLGDMSDGAFDFQVMVLPRQRLNQRLEAGQPGLVMWANPAWFGDTGRTRYRWTTPILKDRNVVISPTDVAFEYSGPRSLTGAMLVGVRGHRYQDVDRLVAGRLVDRMDVRSERSLVQFIASNRGRVAIVAESAMTYYIQNLGLGDAIHISDQPHSNYHRYIMVQPDLEDVRDFLEDAVPKLIASRAWQKIISDYGLIRPDSP